MKYYYDYHSTAASASGLSSQLKSYICMYEFMGKNADDFQIKPNKKGPTTLENDFWNSLLHSFSHLFLEYHMEKTHLLICGQINCWISFLYDVFAATRIILLWKYFHYFSRDSRNGILLSPLRIYKSIHTLMGNHIS